MMYIPSFPHTKPCLSDYLIVVCFVVSIVAMFLLLLVNRLNREEDDSVEANHGRGRTRTFRVFDYFWLGAIHQGHTAVGGPQVNTNYFTHIVLVPFCSRPG